MKSIWKGFIVGIILVAIGAGIIVTTLAVNGWEIAEANYTMKTFIEENDNTSVEIDLGANTLKTEFYDGEKIEISYPDGSGFKTSITERGGKLKFETKTKWYATFFNVKKLPETVVKLPKDKTFDIKVDLGAGTVILAGGVYGNLDLDVSAGTLKFDDVTCRDIKCDLSAGTVKANGINCNNLKCDVSAGTLNISSLTCPDINASVSAGTINLGVSGAKSEYTIHASTSVGKCNVSNQTGTTDKKLDASCSAGTLNVNFSD